MRKESEGSKTMVVAVASESAEARMRVDSVKLMSRSSLRRGQWHSDSLEYAAAMTDGRFLAMCCSEYAMQPENASFDAN